MKQLHHIPLILAISAVFIAGCAGESGDTDTEDMPDAAREMADEPVADRMDAVSVAPDVYTVLHEDDRVRVLDMVLPAGETDGLHSHPNEAVYFIEGSTVRISVPGEEPTELDIPDGAPLSHEAWTHTVENIGESDLHAVVVEIKEGALESAGSVADGMAAHETSPDTYSVLLEDDRVRILEMTLPAGESDSLHSHPAETAYFLKGGTVNIHLPGGEVNEAEIPDGGVISHEAWTHRVENVGATDIHAIVVEFKEPAM